MRKSRRSGFARHAVRALARGVSAAVLLFASRLPDRRLAAADRPPWSLREVVGTFYVDPRRNRDFAWAFLSRFLLVTAYAPPL